MPRKFLLIIIVILILTLAGGVIVTLWYMDHQNEGKNEHIKIEKQVNSEDDSLSNIGPLYPLTPITVNLKTANAKDIYLTATLSLELDNKLLSNELDDKNAVIRDEIIFILSNKTPQDVSSELGKQIICDQIKNKLNSMLTDGKIKNVYIVKFIIQ